MMGSEVQPTEPFVFILNWERPLYLWSCLDSFYRTTKSNCKFVLTDNASTDPQVRDVIAGFQRRNMFHEVHLETVNHPRRFELLVEKYWDEIGDYFVFIEGDTAVVESEYCWLQTMCAHMDSDESIGSIGSRVYKEDFISIEAGKKLCPELSDKDLEFAIKAHAPMRRYEHTDSPLICPHNPPLRLLMMRKKAYKEVGFGLDTEIHNKLIDKGWKSVISTEVVHRHLSLLNIYDYPDYGRAHRDKFFNVA